MTQMDLSAKHRDQTCGCWGATDWEFGVNRYQLLCIEWIPLYSIVNYVQYPVINHNRKECEIFIYDWITLLDSRSYNFVNQLYLNKIKIFKELLLLLLLLVLRRKNKSLASVNLQSQRNHSKYRTVGPRPQEGVWLEPQHSCFIIFFFFSLST